MPAVPSSLLEPIWVEFHALLNEARGGEPPRFDPSHRGVATVSGSRTGWCSSTSSSGLKRSTATDAHGIPLGIVSAGANRHDSPLLAPTLTAAFTQLTGPMPDKATAHLDAAYDSAITRQLLDGLGLDGQIARKGVPAPIQVGKRWVSSERTPG